MKNILTTPDWKLDGFNNEEEYNRYLHINEMDLFLDAALRLFNSLDEDDKAELDSIITYFDELDEIDQECFLTVFMDKYIGR